VDVAKELDEACPTHVVSFIGRTHGKHGDKVYTTIDFLEQKGRLFENCRDNIFAPILLAELCRRRSIHMTYLGTGCIFTYDEKHPYEKEVNGFKEEDLPNFFGSSYSCVKGYTDRLMHLYSDTALNLRIRMPISNVHDDRNFIKKIVTYEKICSIRNSMTVLPIMLPYVVKMMKMNTTGTINMTNPGLISHNEVLEMYREYVDPKFVWKNFSIEEQAKILAADRSNNFLDTTKLETLFPDCPSIKDATRMMLQDYKFPNGRPPPRTLDVDSKNTMQTAAVDIEDSPEKTILVTGGCGFIGSHFINHFMKKYTKIKMVNIDAMYYAANKNNVAVDVRNDKDRYLLVQGSICSMDLVKYIVESHSIQYVVHFAAQSHVQDSFTDSLRYTNDNVVGTHTLLECFRLYSKVPLEKFIHCSTDEVYGESMLGKSEGHKTESSVLCPTNPYAATKAAAELIAQSYNHSFRMPIAITRGNNVYGPNQYVEKLIPRFIDQLLHDKPVTIQGDGSCVRAFLHAYDTAEAFAKVLEKGQIGEIYNIGCDEGMEYSVRDIAHMLIAKIKPGDSVDKWISYIEDRPFNDKRYYISNQRLKDLGWRIAVPLERGIDHLIEYMKEGKMGEGKVSMDVSSEDESNPQASS